ncbi:hypothetical protein [Psychromonas ossibalaenae]|uniref:hypothetical protein n=1 Tax=Psychromonas ossibalaenae TaxID=444922 RepID=UPI00035CDAFC|nr:hypothetical protein [Psychromonas ossibalaenae]
MSKSRSHDEATVEMIQSDKEYAKAYLHTALEERKEEGGEVAFLIAMRHFQEAEVIQKTKNLI